MITRRLLIASTAAGAAGLSSLGRAFAQSDAGPTEEQVYNDPGNPVLGNPKGDVTVVEFFDFQCPYCKRDFPNVRDVVEKDGNVRLVLKDWPVFGPPSVYASHLVLAAFHTGKFEPTLNALMATPGKLNEEQVDATLAKAGVDLSDLKAAFRAHAKDIDATLKRNYALADAFGFRGTPSYVIGHTLFGGVVDKRTFVEAIAKARQPA